MLLRESDACLSRDRKESDSLERESGTLERERCLFTSGHKMLLRGYAEESGISYKL